MRYAGQLEIDMCREIYPELADSQYSRNADELTKEELEELLESSVYEVIDLTERWGKNNGTIVMSRPERGDDV